MKRFAVALGFVLGAYLLVRAIAEPFVIDMSNPSTYRDDWGGPSLTGVLAVHCLPGVIAGVIMALSLRRRIALTSKRVRLGPNAP